jgi:hypothetical protein
MQDRLALLPDVLQCLDGKTVSSKEEWLAVRRPEISELFREHVFGREPEGKPSGLRFETVTEASALNGAAVRKQVVIRFAGPNGEGSFPLLLFIPVQREGAVPAFVLINNRAQDAMDPASPMPNDPFFPAEQLVSEGFAAAVFQTNDIDPDVDDGFKNGVHGILDPISEPRPANAWGTIAAWAWGASRVMDYLETEEGVDANRVALVGHSRGGKTALWAGALDPRFAMVVSNNSGCTGAALSRGKQGETIRDINTRFPHWFSDNYKRYNGREEELPVDQHMLLALIAPRLLYVASASEDQWADPVSEFLSLTAAAKVYRLFGLQALEEQPFPPADSPIARGQTGYHVRTGLHDLLHSDWRCFIEFAKRHMS